MNLRDQFAFKALEILVNGFTYAEQENITEDDWATACEEVAGTCRSAYYMADAMLATRDMETGV